MAYFYGKVNDKVLSYLKVNKDCLYQYRDGGYLIAMSTMNKLAEKLNISIGSGFEDMYRRTLAQVGGVLMTQQESKDEQDGLVSHPMPIAIDVRFRTAAQTATVSATTNESSSDEDLLNENLGEVDDNAEEESKETEVENE
jgi:hypothetical protein